MVKRIRPDERARATDTHPGLIRDVAISSETVGSSGIYSSVLRTPPGGRTRIHHHGDCETSIYIISGRARFTWGPTGIEHETIADPGDFVYVPANEIHVEANVSLTEALEVIVTRNCAEPITIVVE